MRIAWITLLLWRGSEINDPALGSPPPGRSRLTLEIDNQHDVDLGQLAKWIGQLV